MTKKTMTQLVELVGKLNYSKLSLEIGWKASFFFFFFHLNIAEAKRMKTNNKRSVRLIAPRFWKCQQDQMQKGMHKHPISTISWEIFDKVCCCHVYLWAKRKILSKCREMANKFWAESINRQRAMQSRMRWQPYREVKILCLCFISKIKFLFLITL